MKIRSISLLAIFLLPLPLLADITYTYTGNGFTLYTGPYTASNSISGFITLATPLPANMTILTQITPLVFSFTDGIQTLTDANTLPTTVFAVETDATGDINRWLIGIEDQNNNQIITIDNPDGASLGNNRVLDLAAIDAIRAQGLNVNMPGVWTFPHSTDPNSGSVVPEPQTLALTGTALLGLYAAARRRLLR